MSLLDAVRIEARSAPMSGIEAVANYGRDRAGLIPLWSGESDMPTPAFISDAAARGLADGETFYTWQAGIPELRQAIARYYQRHFGKSFGANEFIVTIGGMQAITMALQVTAGAGDEAIYLAPAWPNFAGAAGVAGVRPVPVLLDMTDNGWSCDVEKIAAAITPRTRAIFVNSPSNPTGWTADRETLQAILDLARRKNLWIIADEIYALFHYDGRRSASFMDIMDPEDRILFVNTFSKNWAMTGWRVGWLKTHPSLSRTFENLVQYSSSGVAQFMQRGAVAALNHGDGFVRENYERALTSRDILCDALIATNRVETLKPDGALYAFLKIDGVTDSRATALDIVDKTGVGLAPGTAFGKGGELFLRACFLRNPKQIEDAADRLASYILGR